MIVDVAVGVALWVFRGVERLGRGVADLSVAGIRGGTHELLVVAVAGEDRERDANDTGKRDEGGVHVHVWMSELGKGYVKGKGEGSSARRS